MVYRHSCLPRYLLASLSSLARNVVWLCAFTLRVFVERVCEETTLYGQRPSSALRAAGKQPTNSGWLIPHIIMNTCLAAFRGRGRVGALDTVQY